MSTPEMSTVWPRALWDAAATEHQLARLCPLCPSTPGVDGLQVTVQGLGSFMIPLHWNADGCTISVPPDGDESTVTWRPCGHTIQVAGRLDQ